MEKASELRVMISSLKRRFAPKENWQRLFANLQAAYVAGEVSDAEHDDILNTLIREAP